MTADEAGNTGNHHSCNLKDPCMPFRSRVSLPSRLSAALLQIAALLCLLVTLTSPESARAGQLSFAWDYAASGAAGFVVYCGTSSRNYTIRSDAGNAVSYRQTGLTDGARYYCAVTAYDAGRVESSYSNEINAVVPAGAPSVNFTATPTSGSAPLNVTFTNSTTGTVTSWLWNFGDGTTSTAKTPTKTYSTNGTYWVSLTATGPNGTATKNAAEAISVGVTSATALVAAYGFAEATGTSVRDSSGKGNAGTISGATWTTAGKYGSALLFNGTSNWVTIQDSASLDLTSGMTLEAWAYPTETMSGWRTLITKQQADGASYYLYANSDINRPANGVFTGTEDILNGTAALPANTWTHLAATYDGNYQRLYVNGVLASSRPQTGAIVASSDALRIGGNSIWGEYFRGVIDEVRIYNRALSATEIKSDMSKAVP
jgi:PKD repeat protein